MNQHQLDEKRNAFLREYFEPIGATGRLNRFNPNCGNSDRHEIGKLKIMLEHMRKGCVVITEPKFKDGKGRPDVVCVTEEEIYEVVESETEASLALKSLKYPLDFNVVTIKKASDVK